MPNVFLNLLTTFMTRLFENLKLKFWSASISNKILLIVCTCSFISLALITGSSVYREFNIVSEREGDKLTSLASILAGNTVAALRFEDSQTATEYLGSLRNEPNITCATLYDAEGEIFASYHRDPDCEDLPLPAQLGAKFTSHFYTYSQAIELSGTRLGTIVIQSDDSKLWNELLTSLAINGSILIVSLAISILLAKRLLPLITRPLEELASLAKQVSEDRNYELRAAKTSHDEVGMLVDSFNFMLSSVRQRDQAINDTNRNLEQLVADRTAKLVSAREKAESALEAKSDFLSTMSHELRTPMNAIIGMSSVLQYNDLDDNRKRQIEIIQKSAVNLLDLINDVLDFSKIEANRLELEHTPFDLVACAEEAMDIAAAAKKNNRLIYCTSFDPTLPTHMMGDVTRLRQILVNLLSNAFKFTKSGSVTLEATHLPKERNRNERLRISVRDTGIGIPESRLKSIFESFTQADRSTSRDYGGTGLGLTISHRLANAMGGDITVESEAGTGSVFHLIVPIVKAESLSSVIGKPLEMAVPLNIRLLDLPHALDAALRSNLTTWGCNVLSLNGVKSVKANLTIASAISEDEFRAVEKATRIENFERVILLAHADHSILVRKTTGAAVLTLPIRNRDLRNLILKHTDSKEAPLYDSSSPFAAYPIEKWAKLRILLAEDNELSRNVFLHHMELIGLEIETAQNGVVACELARENDFDIIFMDVRMPLMDGLRAASEIRETVEENRPQPWIVGFTANTEPEALLDIEKAGMDDYLEKPALIVDIADSINRFFFNKSTGPTALKDA